MWPSGSTAGASRCAPHDHYGHGASSGARGGLPSVDAAGRRPRAGRRRHAASACPDLPLVLLGHSLGGLVAASFVARGVRQVDALVLSSPALDPGLSAFQKFLHRHAVAPRADLARGQRAGRQLPLARPRRGAGLPRRSAVPRPHRCAARALSRRRRRGRPGGRAAVEGAHAADLCGRRSPGEACRQPRLRGRRAGVGASAPPAFRRSITRSSTSAMPQPVFETLQRWLDERFPSA